MTSNFSDLEFPKLDREQVAAAVGGDRAAIDAVGTALFGGWPLPETLDADEMLETYLGARLREFLPIAFANPVMLAAVQRIAAVFESRVIARFKPDRGNFADWARMNIDDLALQEAVAALVAAFGPCEAALKKLPSQQRESVDLNRMTDAPMELRDALRPCRLWEDKRKALAERVWLQFFYVAPDAQKGEALSLPPATAWVADVSRKSGRAMKPAEAEEVAQLFVEKKLLTADFLMRFDPERGASFNQWLKIAVENFTRDQLAKAPELEPVSMSDAFAQSIDASGARVDRMSGRGNGGEEEVAGALGGDAGEEAGIAAEDEFLDHFQPLTLDGTGGEGAFRVEGEGSERLQTLVRVVLPVVLADPYHRTFCKLMFGLPLIRDDLNLIARERLTIWAAEWAVEWLTGKPGREVPAGALADDAIIQSVRESFSQFCTQVIGPPNSSATAKLTDEQRPVAVEWFRDQLAPSLQPPGRKRKTPALPAPLSGKATAERAEKLREQLQQVLMVIEHPTGSAPGIFDALVGALQDLLDAQNREMQIEAKEFRDTLHTSIANARRREKQAEAKRRSMAEESPEYAELTAKIEKYQRTQRQKAEELRRRSFNLRDAEIGRLLGMDSAAVPGLKSRLSRNLAEFVHADQLSKQRKSVAAKLRGKAAKAELERYEKRLEALAAFEAFPSNTAAKAELMRLLGPRITDADADRYADLIRSLVRGKGDVAAMAEALRQIRGQLLDRNSLVTLGAKEADCIAFETAALAYYPALIWLKRLGNLE